MRKHLAILLVLIIVLSIFAGCAKEMTDEEILAKAAELQAEDSSEELSGEPIEEPIPEPTEEPISEPTEEPVPESNMFDEESVVNSLTVEVYDYVNSIKTPWAFLVIKNNSEFNLNITVAIKTYDADGQLVGAVNNDQEAFEKGTEVILSFMLDEEFSNLEYEISAEEEEWYECVVSDLSVEIVSAKDKEIVSVTNNGEKSAEFVEGTILFFRDGELVYWNNTYFTDNDNEIKTGKTITSELTSYEKYDSYKLCFTGRR